MSTKTATKDEIKAQRGTKRTCQKPECGSRFYDLNRDPITCPFCSTVYVPMPPPVVTAEKAHRPAVKTPPYKVKAPKTEDAPDAEAEELVAIEGEEETPAAQEDETFMEVEEESPDVTSIIDAPIEGTDEKA